MLNRFLNFLKSHWLAIAILLVVLILAFPILLYPLWRDNGIYGTIAREMLNGRRLYSDLWDIKPPPIYYLYALAIKIFGDTTWSFRMLDFAVAPLTALGLYWIADKIGFSSSVKYWVLLIFPVFYFTEPFAGLTQSDMFVTLPMTWAVVCTYQATSAEKHSLRWAFLAGAMAGLVMWFKQYYAVFVLALVIYYISIYGRQILKGALAFTLGGLFTGGGLLLFFASQGLIEGMLEVLRETNQYTALGQSFLETLQTLGNYFYFRWLQWAVALILAVIWLILSRLGRRADKSWRLILLWMLAGVVSLVLQAKGFDTHWLPMLPPLCLYAADGLARLLALIADNLNLSSGLQRVIHILAALGLCGIMVYTLWIPALPYMLGQETRHDYYARFQANDLKPAQSLEVVEYLQTRLERGNSLYIWGEHTDVMYMGGWRPPTRYINHFPLAPDWAPPEWRQENVDILWAAMPPYVIVMRADYMPWVTGRNEDSNELLTEYTELANWLVYNYEHDTEIGDFIIWRRKTDS